MTMSRSGSVLIHQENGVMRVTLHRPERRNALNGRMVEELSEAFERAARDPEVRAVILAGSGPAFCAGADIQWLGEQGVSEARARQDAEQLLCMYDTIERCPCPVIGRIHGPAYGGGVGLAAVCDVAVAVEDAVFTLSEVQLGLVPAVIGPALLRKAGESFVRRYSLTAEPFSAEIARRYHLLHDITTQSELDLRVTDIAERIRRLPPQATRQTKQLCADLRAMSVSEQRTAAMEINVQARLSAEAREGLQAFLERRRPRWAEEERASPRAVQH